MAEQQDGRWVTLDNGVHLFIKKGQTLDDAIEKLESEKSEKKTDAKKWAENFQKNLNKTDEQKKKEQEKTINDAKEYWEKVASTSKLEKDREYAKKQLDNFVDSVDRETKPENYKGYDIEKDSTGDGNFSVKFKGVEVIFDSKDEAKAFIDRKTDTTEQNDYKNLSAREYGEKYGKEPKRVDTETARDRAMESFEIGFFSDEGRYRSDAEKERLQTMRNAYIDERNKVYNEIRGKSEEEIDKFVDEKRGELAKLKNQERVKHGWKENPKINEIEGRESFYSALAGSSKLYDEDYDDASWQKWKEGNKEKFAERAKFFPEETQKKTEKLDPATQRVKDYNLKHPHYVEYEMDGKFENGYYTDEEYNKLKNKSWIKITDHKEVDKETGKYGNEKPKGSKEKIDIGGKSYPVKDKKFLKGRTATASNPYGLEKVRTVTYKNGEKYDIYDVGFGNMESNEKFAVLVED